MEEVVELERERGYVAAQEQVTTYLSDRDLAAAWRRCWPSGSRGSTRPEPSSS